MLLRNGVPRNVSQLNNTTCNVSQFERKCGVASNGTSRMPHRQCRQHASGHVGLNDGRGALHR